MTFGLSATIRTARIHCGARRQVVRARQVRDAVRRHRQGGGGIGHRLVGGVEGRAGDVDRVERGQRVRRGCRNGPRRGRRRGSRWGGRERRQYGVERRRGVQGPRFRLIGGCRCARPSCRRPRRSCPRSVARRRAAEAAACASSAASTMGASSAGGGGGSGASSAASTMRCFAQRGGRRRQRRMRAARRIGQRGRQRVDGRGLSGPEGERTGRLGRRWQFTVDGRGVERLRLLDDIARRRAGQRPPQTGHAPLPWVASTRSATAICSSLVAM